MDKHKFMDTSVTNISQGNELTVAQLAIAYPGALAVFTKYSIDYCCGGHRGLKEACHRIGLDPETIYREIEQCAITDSTQVLRPENWSSPFLTDFIVENHHSYVKRTILELEALLDKVCDRHGADTPELLEIRENFLALSTELTSHMEKEESFLFPAIKRLEAQRSKNNPMERMIQTPILAMEDEHEAAGDLIKRIRASSDNYTAPEYACPTFRITFQRLKEFDNDLMKHIHLENNILFKRFKNPVSPFSCSI